MNGFNCSVCLCNDEDAVKVVVIVMYGVAVSIDAYLISVSIPFV